MRVPILSEKKISIGWATTSITPSKPVVLVGQFHPRISRYVHDLIMATALVIETDDDYAIMVSCDLSFIEESIQAKLREKIKHRLPNLDMRKIFLNATHTHTAPNMIEGWYGPQSEEVMNESEYVDFLINCLLDVILNAYENRKPAGISWGLGHAVVGHNRRVVYLDGHAQMYGGTNVDNFDCIEGYEDHSLNLIFVWDEKHELTGIVINIACPSQVTEGEYYISADFWHEVRSELRKRYSDNLFVLTQCSSAGDQSPHFLLFGKLEEEMRKKRGVSERQEIAIRIADAIDRVFPIAKMDIRTRLPFKHIAYDVSLPVRKVTGAEYEQAKREYEKLLNKGKLDAQLGDYIQLGRNETTIERYEKQWDNPFFQTQINVMRLGDIAIASNPFEMYLDYGIRIKARSKALQTFIVQLAGDCVCYHGAGYLPTAKAIAGGGYGAEVASNLVGPEGGQILVEETLKLINSMW
ncbi:TPA: hypothetical protein ENS27_03320 [bacterium]|nr:hypothetical protein [bacterium]